MKYLVIAEKPSVSKSIAKVIGAYRQEDGYLEGGDCVVSWCLGHLAEYLEEAIMFTPKPQEYTDPLTGEMKKKQMKFFPDAYKNRIGKSYNDYIADHQMNMFEDFIGYQSSTVLDEPEREAGTTSIPIPQREESENIPSPDLPEQLENVQQSGNEIAERGMQT